MSKKAGSNTPKNKIAKTIEQFDLLEEFSNSALEYLYNGKLSSNTKLALYTKLLFEPLALTDDNKANALYNVSKLIDILEWLQENVNKRRSNDKELTEFLLYKILFDWQKEVYNDTSKIITMLCGRRSGKSFVDAAMMIKHCLDGPDEINTPQGKVSKPRVAYYIGLTTDKAKEIMWPVLTTLVEKCRVPYTKIDNSSLCITLQNGSELRLHGNANTAQQEKLRGLDFSMVIIDEMQSQKGLTYLLDSIVSPILSGRDGTMILSGTSPLSAGTLWEKYINNPNISHYHATMLDNPSIPDHENALDKVLEQHGWDANNITFRREYLAEIAYDTSILVYPTRSYYEDNKLPEDFKPIKCYIGLDYGYRDCTAFAPIFIDENNNMILCHEFKQSGMSASAKVQKAKELNEFIKDTYKLDDIWFIQDHNEQDVGADIFAEGITNITNANKRNEVYQIQLVRDCLESGRLKIQKENYFDDECDRLIWQTDPVTGTVIYKLDDKAYHGDICDAVRYAVAMVVPSNLVQDDVSSD